MKRDNENYTSLPAVGRNWGVVSCAQCVFRGLERRLQIVLML